MARADDEAPAGGGKRVALVVEDEAIVRLSAVQMIEELGFEVLEAGDGLQALAVLEARPDVALLFSDCRMPRMGGPELAEAATSRWPHLRVVLVSGYAGVAPARWPLLAKPYQMGDLERVLLGAGLAGG